MHTPRLSLRAAVFVGLTLAGASVLAEAPANSQIYQQRAADGSIVLTDRPSPKAVTERTWQLQHEDAGAAQRAVDVRREAAAVSERIQRQIEAQERRAADQDLMRSRVARLERADDVDDSGDGYGIGVPLFRQFGRRHHGAGFADQPGFHRHGQSTGPSRSGGAGPGFNQR